MSATPGPWKFVPWHIEEGPPAIRCAEGWIVATTAYDDDARLIAASPRLADALWGLLVALGKHTPDMTPAMLADICPACDEATAALIESGRVMG